MKFSCLLRAGSTRRLAVVILLACGAAELGAQDVYIEFGDTWKFFRGTAEPSVPATAWREPGFSDGAWESGATGIGYGDGDDVTVLDDMQGSYTTVYLRKEFNVPDPAAISTLSLFADYDDGFVGYVNGVEVVRANAGVTGEDLPFDATADGNHEAGSITVFDLTAGIASLLPGPNLLAVELLNQALTSSDLSFNVRLSADDVRVDCPTGAACARSLVDGTVTVSWTNSAAVAYESISVTRDGTPLPGSPFAGDTEVVVDSNPGDFNNDYEIVATVAGVDCDPVGCSTNALGFELIDEAEEWRFFRGTAAPSAPMSAWREPGFDDSSWEVGPTGIGYGDGDDATELTDMQGSYVTVYARKIFLVPDLGIVSNLILEMDYDDSFIAYLNGTEVARSATIGDPGEEFAFDEPSPGSHEAGTVENYDLTPFLGELFEGDNLLAVEIHNTGLTSSDLSFIPSLEFNNCATPQVDCAFNEPTGEVVLSWGAFPYDSVSVTRNGAPLPGSPFPGGTTRVVDPSPSANDNEYEVTGTVAGAECGTATCRVNCGARDPEALTCVLSLAGGVTRAELSWTSVPAGTQSIEVVREGLVLATLAASRRNYLDPDVESAEPEDDTDYDVVFNLASGETCTLECGPLSLCPENFTCRPFDDGTALRVEITWDNIVKEWESFTIQRDGQDIAIGLPGETTRFLDDQVALAIGEPHTYTLVPVAPAGEEVGTACNATCTVAAPIPELADYDPPAGGWDYRIDFESPNDDRYAATAGVAGNLDGNWIREAALDSWDGSGPLEVGAAPGGPAPGGVEVETAPGGGPCGEDTGVLRVVDPGDPSNPGGSLSGEFPVAFDEPNNRRIVLGLDTGISGRNLLRDGVTFTARWRLSPNPPEYLNAGVNGDGQGLSGGVGHVGLYFTDDGTLGTAGDPAALAFSLASNNSAQLSTNPTSTLAGAGVSSFHSIWVTVEDPEADDTYDITFYLNGEEAPFGFFGTLTGVALQQAALDFGAPAVNYLVIALPSAGEDADIQIDYIGYKEGVHLPASTLCVPTDNNRPTARISVSPSATVRLAAGQAQVTLDGSGSDDGDGGAQGLTFRWSKVGGPGGDTIAMPSGSSTLVTFTQEGVYRYVLRVDDGQAGNNTDTEVVDITVEPEGAGGGFVRGDVDQSGVLNLTDGIQVLLHLFRAGGLPRPLACLDAADADDSGALALTDGVRIFQFLFRSGTLPVPSPETTGQGTAADPGDCGPDPTADGTDCATPPGYCQ